MSYYLEMAWATLRSAPQPVLAVVVVVLGISAGFLATKLSLSTMMLVLGGLAVLFFSFSRPEFVILLTLVASSSIFALNQIPTINVGFAFSSIELCLIFLLGLVVIQALGNKENPFVTTPLNLPIALFFGASFISLLNAVLSLGADIDQLEYQWRILFNYLAFFTVTNLIRTRDQLMTLVVGMFVIATVVGILMIAQQAVGTSVTILPGRVETAGVGDTDFSGVTRILPPGQSMIQVMFMPAFILFVFHNHLGRARGLVFGAVLALSAALAFTFNRSTWAGMAASIAVVFWFSNKNQRKNLFLFLCIIMVFGAIAIPLLGMYFPQLNDIFGALYIRAMSLFTGDEVKYSSSWQWRVMENEYALKVIKQHPLLGIGPGNNYRPRVRLGGDSNTGYMHNAYFFILMDLGLVGFIPFVWFSVLFMVRAYRLWSTIRDKTFMSVALGFCLSYITVLIASTASPMFMDWFWTPVLGVMLGVNEVIYRLNGRVIE
ncbi:MAG: O-antigen ligase family protein [Chloroflexi bacterium]|nr:O-antigen ligase family protein [Chloroflexota bacterium]